MIFTLETIQAKHGDCLILYYGNTEKPEIIVIDGGPAGVYSEFLKKRLMRLRDGMVAEGPLGISMLMVSHLDDDHIHGVLELLDEIEDASKSGTSPDISVSNLWVNVFDDIIGNIEIQKIAGLSQGASVAGLISAIPYFKNVDREVSAVIASTGQGRKIRDLADALCINVNFPFKPMAAGKKAIIRRDGTDGNIIPWGSGLNIQILHPTHQRLVKMQEAWDKDLKKAKKQGDETIIFASLGSTDTSPFNLASVVCLMEFEGKRILLTGDSRGDDIIAGIENAGLFDETGHIHVDVLKLPHHGSSRNIAPDFFEKITAGNYIISADGKNGNPDIATLKMLSKATQNRNDFTIYMTNETGENNLQKVISDFIQEERSMGRTYEMKFIKTGDLSLTLNLLDALTF